MANGSTFWTFEVWLHGLLGAFIGGAAGAVSSGLGSTLVAPQQFNLHQGLFHTLELMGTVALINGFITAAAYLKQSPVPALPPGTVVTTATSSSAVVTTSVTPPIAESPKQEP
jgi:hypothetical protein